MLKQPHKAPDAEAPTKSQHKEPDKPGEESERTDLHGLLLRCLRGAVLGGGGGRGGGGCGGGHRGDPPEGRAERAAEQRGGESGGGI